ncbi:MAG: FecR domain-containing protein, partial [Bdellovibrionota bacterium]
FHLWRSGSETPPIADLISHRNETLFQAPGEVIWASTHDGQTLHRNARVMTLERSKAEIAFLDGTGIVVEENTMIELERNPTEGPGLKSLRLKLVRGSIRKAPRHALAGAPAPQVEIETAGSTLEVSPLSELAVSVEASGKAARVQVFAGEAQAQGSADSAPVTIGAGDEASLGKKVTARKAVFSLAGPVNGETLGLPSDGRVNFRWTVDPSAIGAHPTVLEASTHADFSGEVRHVTIAASEPPLAQVEAKLKLTEPAGRSEQWYWRVRALDADTLTSPVEKFWTERSVAPELRYPPDASHVAAGAGVELAWGALEGASYTLELDGAERAVAAPTAALDAPGAGEHRWRVRAKLVDGTETGWSAARTFTVAGAAPVAAPVPIATTSPEKQKPVVRQVEVEKPVVKPKKAAPPPPPEDLEGDAITEKPAVKRKKK